MQHIKQERENKIHKSRKNNEKRQEKNKTNCNRALLGHFPKYFVTGFCSFRATHTHTGTRRYTHTHTGKRAACPWKYAAECVLGNLFYVFVFISKLIVLN